MADDGLLLYGLMDGDLIPGVHLSNLSIQKSRLRQQGPGLDDELTALPVPHQGDPQTHSAASLVAGVHCAGSIIREKL